MLLSFISFIKNNKTLTIIITIAVLIAIILGIYFLSKKKREKLKTNEIACIGVFSALSIILYFLKFNLPFLFPDFLEIHFSMLPIIIIGFMFGPIESIYMLIVRAIIKLPFTGTFCVGELADLLIGIPIVLSTSITYKKIHSKKGAVISLLIGIFVWVISSIIINYFINVPAYIALYWGGNLEPFISLLKVIPGVTSENYMIRYLLYAVLPFNTLLSVLVSLVTFIVYKRVSILFDKISDKYNAR